MMDYDKLLELARRWKKEAMERVPEEYASRDLHRKYLNCDNYAGGLNDCADELLELLERDAEPHVHPTEAGGEYCICEKPLDDDGWRCIRCGKLLSPRLGG